MPTGLSTSVAHSLQQKFGKNVLSHNKITLPKVILRQLNSPFTYLLLAAAFLALWLREFTDGTMILGFTILNVVLGTYQEFRSEKTAELLNHLIRPTSKVFRDNKQISLPTEDLVPGDIISLSPGDIIPADCTLLTLISSFISVDQSTLTGESLPVSTHKTGGNLFAGTSLLSGSCHAKVIKIGHQTSLGSLAKIATQTKKRSAYEQNIATISAFTLKLIGIILLITYIANLAFKGFSSIPETTLFIIAIAVSVIPEALPVVTTFSLSRGALRLAKMKVIVKRLSAIEDLGGIEILATDKTGTLTNNVLTLADSLSLSISTPLFDLAAASATGSDPIDLVLSNKHHSKIHHDIPFDPIRKYSSTVLTHHNQIYLVLKGVPEVLHSLSKHKPSSKESTFLTSTQQAGHRTIAVSYLRLSKLPTSITPKLEKSTHLLGYLALADSLKPTAIQAVKDAAKLNIALKIISGDSVEVCGNIAKKVGLIEDVNQVVSGTDLAKLSSSELHEVIEKTTVFARISPLQKKQILEILQESHVVGFVGEGINDAPALKVANVAVAVKEASDIAREAADIILTNKSLSTIVEGIKEGRIVFANTAKYIKITLAANIGNFIALAISSLLVPFLPMLPIQILLVNLLSDFPMIAVAADSVDPSEATRPQHYDMKDIALTALVMGTISAVFDIIVFSYFVKAGASVLQTCWFIESIVSELAFFYSLRSSSWIFKAKLPPLGINLLTGFTILITILLPFTALGHTKLSFISPTINQLSMIAFLVLAYIVTTEIAKKVYARSSTSPNL
ncbi:MAG: HAD-IC family P-type ATPase [bacterium]